MWNVLKSPELLVSIISACIALVAIWQTHKQIKLSNKQQLFERRLNSYMFLSDFLGLYKTSRELIEQERQDKPIESIENEFVYLTNSAYLENITYVIREQFFSDLHKRFLLKREEIKKEAKTLLFLFDKKISAPMSDFLLCYEKLLAEMRAYQKFLNDVRDDSDKEIVIRKMTMEQRLDFFEEKEKREPLLNAYRELKEAYAKIEKEKLEEKLADAICLNKKH